MPHVKKRPKAPKKPNLYRPTKVPQIEAIRAIRIYDDDPAKNTFLADMCHAYVMDLKRPREFRKEAMKIMDKALDVEGMEYTDEALDNYVRSHLCL